jgi:hypothetical protein
MARVKAWLLATRYTTRDYLDTVVLFERLGESGVRQALSELDAIYPQATGASALIKLIESPNPRGVLIHQKHVWVTVSGVLECMERSISDFEKMTLSSTRSLLKHFEQPAKARHALPSSEAQHGGWIELNLYLLYAEAETYGIYSPRIGSLLKEGPK